MKRGLIGENSLSTIRETFKN